MSRERTCLNCGWVHFGLTREQAVEQLESFARWFEQQDPLTQRQYAPVRDPCTCFKCGGSYKNFRDALEGDAPIGCTIQGIIVDETQPS